MKLWDGGMFVLFLSRFSFSLGIRRGSQDLFTEAVCYIHHPVTQGAQKEGAVRKG